MSGLPSPVASTRSTRCPESSHFSCSTVSACEPDGIFACATALCLSLPPHAKRQVTRSQERFIDVRSGWCRAGYYSRLGGTLQEAKNHAASNTCLGAQFVDAPA